MDNCNISYSDEIKDPIIWKTVIQAIGRLCRTSSKKEKCLVIMDDGIARTLHRGYDMLSKRMNNILFTNILSRIMAKFITLKEINNELTIYNDLNTNLTHQKMRYLSFNWWTELKKSDYIDVRNLLLYNPTPNIDDIKDKEMFYMRFEEKVIEYSYHQRRKGNNELLLYNINENIVFSDSFAPRINEHKSGLKRMMKSSVIKKYFIENNIPIKFEKSHYILNPVAFNVYKVAIGEMALQAIFKHERIKIYEIDELKHFEKFDFMNGEVYFDVKNWNITFNSDAEKMKEKVLKKAVKVNAKVVVYINILYEGSKDTKRIYEDGYSVIEIPWLYDSESNEYNIQAIDEIKDVIVKYGNKN